MKKLIVLSLIFFILGGTAFAISSLGPRQPIYYSIVIYEGGIRQANLTVYLIGSNGSALASTITTSNGIANFPSNYRYVSLSGIRVYLRPGIYPIQHSSTGDYVELIKDTSKPY